MLFIFLIERIERVENLIERMLVCKDFCTYQKKIKNNWI